MQATVSATFRDVSAAETAVASLLQAGFDGPAVGVKQQAAENAWVVTVAANERVVEVEDLLRRQLPLHWQSSIEDGVPAPSGFIHLAPEADLLEQDAPWGAGTTQATTPRPGISSDADWLEQAQAAYRAGDNGAPGSRPSPFVPYADYAEQSASAYREPIEYEES